ncbi:MAG: aspartate kinase [Chlorobi bacterium]|nr:aspartate kinase [Chlorobiota bacterium]
MIVMKFGGTSVAGERQLRHVSALVRAEAMRKPVLVVVSAFRGVTDALLECARTAAEGRQWEPQWQQIADIHRSVAHRLNLTAETTVEALLEDLRCYLTGIALVGECTGQMLDHTAAFGELLCSRVLAAFLVHTGERAAWLDARNAIKTDPQFTAANLNWSLTKDAVERNVVPLLKHHRVVVTQGFIASTPTGQTTTLGRGGSDYSAAIFGACLGTERVEIWTDVSGIFSADPRIVTDAVSLPEITLGEVAALSAYGAKVLHPLTIGPAIEHGIPVLVRNTFEPEHPGTTITATLQHMTEGIRAITMRNAVIQRGEVLELHACDVLAIARTRGEPPTIVVDEPCLGGRAASLFCCVGAGIHHRGTGLRQLAAAARSVGCSVRVIASASESIVAAVEPSYSSVFLQALHETMYQSQEAAIS